MKAKIYTAVAVMALLVILLMFVRSRTNPAQPSSSQQPASTNSSPQPSSLPAVSPAPGIPAQRHIAEDILHLGLTPERARILFAMTVGPLPGVAVPAGGRDPADFDGTQAIAYLVRVWDSLTLEQQKAAAALIHPSPETHAQRSLLPAALSASANFLLFSPDTPAADYKTLASNADGTLGVMLRVPGVQYTVDVDYGTPEGTEYGHTWSWTLGNVLGWDKGCHITLWNQKFQGLDEADAEAVVTHEMFHCFQQRTAQTASSYSTVKPWIGEGEATWAMFTVVPASKNTNIQEGKWNLYVFGPMTVYSDRSYDALGVMGHMSDLAGDQPVWSRLLPMVTAGIGGNDQDAFDVLTQGMQSSYFDSWGASYFLNPGSRPWSMFGPGSPPSSGPAPTSVTVEDGTEEALASAGPYQSELFQLTGGADIVRVALFTGYGRLHDQGFATDTALENSAPLSLCLRRGGCSCPDGSPGASQFTRVAIAPLSIGINGGDKGAQIGVAGQSLDEYCKKPDPPQQPAPPPPGGGGGGGGGGGQPPPDKPHPVGESYGDTHLSTFDGLKYDFQVVGEYTLVRSTQDDFAVQIRQVPVPGTNNASVNQAVATTLGGRRITISMENNAPVLRIDGKSVSGPLPALKNGSLSSSVTAFGTNYQLTWPDGTEVRVEQLGRYALNVKVRPAASRRGALEGLLGNNDGVPGNDLGKLPATVASSAQPADQDQMNHVFADAWRVKQSSALFDYQPGQSTATFTNPHFPATGPEATISNRADAEKACRERNITDPQMLENCIVDLAATHDFIFGSHYAHAQQVLAANALLLKPKVEPVAARTAMVFSGEILDAHSTREFTFDANQGEVLWIHNPDCTDHEGQSHPVSLNVFDPGGKRIGGDYGCQVGRLELPMTGRYSIRAVFPYPGEVVRFSIPIRFVRPTRRQTIHYGEIVSGNIDAPGVRDVYNWTGDAGDVVLLSGPGCDLGALLTDFTDPRGYDLLAPNCRAGTIYKLPVAGTWQLVINSADWPSGPYHFVFQGGKAGMQ